MERIQILTALRRSDITLPEDYEAGGGRKAHAAVIRQLLSHEPGERPSARDLLASPLLPPVQEVTRVFISHIHYVQYHEYLYLT